MLSCGMGRGAGCACIKTEVIFQMIKYVPAKTNANQEDTKYSNQRFLRVHFWSFNL